MTVMSVRRLHTAALTHWQPASFREADHHPTTTGNTEFFLCVNCEQSHLDIIFHFHFFSKMFSAKGREVPQLIAIPFTFIIRILD